MVTRLFALLDATERRRAIALLPFVMLSAVVEVVAVAAVVPFMALLAGAGDQVQVPWLAAAFAATGDRYVVVLRVTGVALAAAIFLANALVATTTWWLHKFSADLSHSISVRLLAHYAHQPYEFFLVRNSAALATRVLGHVGQVVDQGIRATLEVVAKAVVVTALLMFLVALDPRTALIAAAAIGGAYAVVFNLTRRHLLLMGREAVVAGAHRLKAVNELLGGFKDLRVLGRERFAYQQYIDPSRRHATTHAAMAAVSGLPRNALEAVAVGGLVLVASLAAGPSGSGIGTVPLLAAYAFAGLRIMPAAQALFAAVASIRFATGALEGIEKDFRVTEHREPNLKSPPELLRFDRRIELRRVSYTYPNARGCALDAVDVAIERDRTLAIVGSTGSGKTTLVDVLLGLLDPEHGQLLVDGVVVTRDNLRSYRRLFGYVPQSMFLVDDSVAANVALAVPEDEIDMDAVARACRQAQIAEFIELELPHGYRTRLGERGVRLSGGQRQRIGIARALYHQPQVLVFDEATSALDIHTERAVYLALEEIARERTVVTIAHRLETVTKADRVVVLDRGRVVDEGPAGEVLERYRGVMNLRE